MSSTLKSLLGLSVAIAWCLAGTAQAQINYPNKPVRILMPFAPGSGLDIATRQIAKGYSDALGQPFVVEVKQGGVGVVAMQELAKSPPDGYTLGYVNSAISVSQWLLGDGSFLMTRDVTPVGLMSFTYNVLVVAPNLPVNSVAELVSMAKAKPGALSYASGGNGTPAHLQGELFRRSVGIDVVHVPYKALATAFTDMGRGEVHYVFGVASSVVPVLKAGRLKALAVAAPKRMPTLPDVPTMEELGYKGIDVRSWGSIGATAGTPAAVINKLNTTLKTVLADPATVKLWDTLGSEIPQATLADAADLYRSETLRWEKFLKENPIKID